MNNQWRSFLESRSAQVDESDRVFFDGGDNLTECNIFDLSHLRLTRISGSDSETFLQGQITNDIRQVTGDHHQMAGYCTPKGRMLANFRIFLHDGAYILQTPDDTHENLLKRLTMFILRSDVTIHDASDDLVTIGLAGNCSKDLLNKLFDELPTEPGTSLEHQGISLLCLPGSTPRYQLTGEPDYISPIWEEFSNQAQESNPDLWALLDIRAGIPTVYTDTVEAFVPQMVNMQLVDGVSFDKGCYVGQEVVARMKYLGVLKRRMHLARVDTDQRPAPGEKLFSSSESDSGQGAGNVVMSAPAPEGGFELLAVVENAGFEQGDLHIKDSSGPKLIFLPMPYEFE